MPSRPPKQCDRCRRTFTGERCPCRKPWEGSRRSGKSTRAYRLYRDNYLAEHTLCEIPGCKAPSTDADHIVPIGEGGHMFGPLRALCAAHHQEVTLAQARLGRTRPR